MLMKIRVLLPVILLSLALVPAAISAKKGFKGKDAYNIERGQEAMEEGRYQAAADYFQAEARTNPENGYAWCFLGVVRHGERNLAAAHEAYAMALHHVPKKDYEIRQNLWIMRGQVLLELRDTLKAFDNYTAGLRESRWYEGVYLKRAKLLVETGRLAEAEKDYINLIGHHEMSAGAYVGLAQLRNMQGAYDDALVLLDKAVSLNPGYGEAYRERIKTYIGKKDLARAADDQLFLLGKQFGDRVSIEWSTVEALGPVFRGKLKAMALKEEYNHVYPYLLGKLSARDGDHLTAIEYARKANALEGSDVNPLILIANSYNSLGLFGEALRYARKAMAIAPRDVEAADMRVIAASAMGDAALAVEYCDSLVAMEPNNPFAFYLRSVMRGFAGAPETDVDEDLDMALALDVNYINALAAEADRDMARGDSVAAMAGYRRVLELTARGDSSSFAQVAAAMGDPGAAMRYVNRQVAANPADDKALYSKACLLARLNHRDNAMRVLFKAVDKGFLDSVYISRDPDLKPLREHPRMPELMDTIRVRIDANRRAAAARFPDDFD